ALKLLFQQSRIRVSIAGIIDKERFRAPAGKFFLIDVDFDRFKDDLLRGKVSLFLDSKHGKAVGNSTGLRHGEEFSIGKGSGEKRKARVPGSAAPPHETPLRPFLL